jgi:sugar/nucleoside kinase (ribokinase family)
MSRPSLDIISVGSPIMDLIAEIAEEDLATLGGEKGGMTLVESDTFSTLLDRLTVSPVMMPGGSAANTAFALARLGLDCGILGKLGDDHRGTLYQSAFARAGGDCSRFKLHEEAATACCLSLVTPDSERTMHTDLGAAKFLAPDDIAHHDFHGVRHAHVEGYLLFNPDLLLSVCRTAQAAGCRISLDLGAFQVVEAMQDMLPGLLTNYIDIVFANEDEASAFCGEPDPHVGLQALGRHCEIAVVKVGAKGAWIQHNDSCYHIPAHQVDEVVDTTGAGDLWAAGFLYGLLNNHPLELCGHLGSVISSYIVQHPGAALPDHLWDEVRSAIHQHVAPQASVDIEPAG